MELLSENNDNMLIIENVNNFNIKINLKNEQIFFNYKNKNENSFKQKIFSLEELQIISKLFYIYDNINEIFESIKDIILNSELSKRYPNIIKRNNKEFFIIYLNLGKYKYIEFPLNLEHQKNIIKIDENFLNQIEEDIKIFDSFADTYVKNEKKIANLKQKNEDLKLKIENYKEKINNNNYYYYNVNNSYEHFVLIQQHYKSIKFNELLILEKNLYICNLIISNFKNAKLYFNLIYKATIDGDKAQNFHNKVDGKNQLIILVKTSENIIIGGYTSNPWSSSDDFMFDYNAFLFSINKKEKYNIINYNKACFHSKQNGPCFGNNGELRIVDNCFKEYSMTNNDSNCYKFKKHLIGQNRVSLFTVKEYEVYQVIFNEYNFDNKC